MRSLTIDTSVIVKWIFPERANEDHMPQALNLLMAIRQGAFKVKQPPHWLAEAAAVIVRLQPRIAEEAIRLLNAMEFLTVNTDEIYYTGCQLAERFNHHLFDTLYHAVALCSANTQLVTADEQYYRKVNKEGSIIRLAEFTIFNN